MVGLPQVSAVSDKSRRTPYTVLIVEDEQSLVSALATRLHSYGFEVIAASSGDVGLEIFQRESPDIAVVSDSAPGVSSTELLQHMREASPAAVVVFTGVDAASDRGAELIDNGAFECLEKPFRVTELLGILRRASEILELRLRVSDSVESAKGAYNFGRIWTQNVETSGMLEKARKAAEADHTTILIQGDSGTGKGVLARAIHYASPRATMPLLEINCAALPDTLLESELFGYEAGAFTDARRRKKGLLERANGGTVFLDEIGNMSASVQAKVLQVLEDGTFWRLGGAQSITVNVRLIAATNVNLRKAVAEGQFREDLFYRLNVMPLWIPPLRQRKEDILPLALEMVQQFNQELGKKFMGFTPAAAHLLRQYPWPGNIRELRNVIERSMILSSEWLLDAPDLPEEILRTASPVDSIISAGNGISPDLEKFVTLRELQDDYIEQVLAATGHNKSLTARILGIHPTSLLRHFKRKEASLGEVEAPN